MTLLARTLDDQLIDRVHDRALRATVTSWWLGVCADDPQVAKAEALKSIGLTEQLGLIPHQFFNIMTMLWVACETNDIEELNRWIAYHDTLAASTHIRLYAPCVVAAKARIFCETGDLKRWFAALREVMDWARNNVQRVCAPAFLMAWTRDLCELALRFQIETEFARESNRANHYKPRPRNTTEWP